MRSPPVDDGGDVAVETLASGAGSAFAWGLRGASTGSLGPPLHDAMAMAMPTSHTARVSAGELEGGREVPPSSMEELEGGREVPPSSMEELEGGREALPSSMMSGHRIGKAQCTRTFGLCTSRRRAESSARGQAVCYSRPSTHAAAGPLRGPRGPARGRTPRRSRVLSRDSRSRIIRIRIRATRERTNAFERSTSPIRSCPMRTGGRITTGSAIAPRTRVAIRRRRALSRWLRRHQRDRGGRDPWRLARRFWCGARRQGRPET